MVLDGGGRGGRGVGGISGGGQPATEGKSARAERGLFDEFAAFDFHGNGLSKATMPHVAVFGQFFLKTKTGE
jgi:hypothetical protein